MVLTREDYESLRTNLQVSVDLAKKNIDIHTKELFWIDQELAKMPKPAPKPDQAPIEQPAATPGPTAITPRPDPVAEAKAKLESKQAAFKPAGV